MIDEYDDDLPRDLATLRSRLRFSRPAVRARTLRQMGAYADPGAVYPKPGDCVRCGRPGMIGSAGLCGECERIEK